MLIAVRYEILWIPTPKAPKKTNNKRSLLDTLKVFLFIPSRMKNNVEKLNWVCQVLEDAALNAYTEATNPDIKVNALKVGFRGEPDEIACKWEFRID